MRKSLGLAILAVAVAMPVGASAAGMSSLQYYVGTWSCQAGPVGVPASNATVTFAMESGVLRESIEVPPQGKMKTLYALSIAATYDAKKGYYVQTGLDNEGGWWVSYAKPWTGTTELWLDHANSDNKPGRNETVRTNQNAYSFNGYATATATKPNFHGSCKRTS